MTKQSPFPHIKTSPKIIRLGVLMYLRFPLSVRNVEDLLNERGVDVSHERSAYSHGMSGRSPSRYFNTSPEIIRLAVMM